jgi:hypothetical protein
VRAEVQGDGVKVGRVGAELVDQAGVDTDDVQVGMNVDTGGMRILHRQGGGAVLEMIGPAKGTSWSGRFF